MSGTGYIAEYPWDEGDTVFASALNAAIGNSVAIGSALVINVKNYGARGDGVTDDTAAIQNAANGVPATGGTLLFPQGVYVVHVAIAVPSNTSVRGEGATLLAAPTGFVLGPLLRNVNSSATTLTDHDIAVRAMTFDYGSSGAGGGEHAVGFSFVRNVLVVGCMFQCRGAGNGTALVGCYNTLVDGCTAYGFINCAYDHWWGPTYGRVVNCYAETAASAQIVNWNPDATSGAITGLTAKGFVLANCTLVGTGATAIPMQLEPLGTGNFVTDVVVHGNTFINVVLVIRGATSNVVVSGNVFDRPLGGNSAIVSYTSFGSPANLSIRGNTIVNPATVAGNLGVIRVACDTAIIANNAVIGATANSLDTATNTPVVIGNYWSTSVNSGQSVAQTGPMRLTSGGVTFGSQVATAYNDFSKHIDLYNGQAGVSLAAGGAMNHVTLGGGTHNFYIGTTSLGYINATGLNMPIGQGTKNLGSFSTIASFNGATWTSNNGVPGGTAPIGSLFSRTDGGVGSTLYVSRGGGVWNAVAGV